MFSDEHRFKQFKGGNPRHNFVWTKSVSEVPGKEMERWGLTVDAWGGFSLQGKTDLVFYEDTLDAPAYQDIVGELAAAGCERVVRGRKGWVGTATGQGDLPHGKVHQDLVGEA